MQDHELVLTHAGKGEPMPAGVQAIFDEAAAIISGLADERERAARQEFLERASRGTFDSFLFMRDGKPAAIICYEAIDDDARLVTGHALRAIDIDKGKIFEMAVQALVEKGFRVIRSNFNWPEPDTYAKKAREMGFIVTERLSMSIDNDPEYAVRPLKEGEIIPWSQSYFNGVAKIMSVTVDPVDMMVYPQFQTYEGCQAMLKTIVENGYGEFQPELSYIAMCDGQLAGYLLSTLYPDNSMLIVDIGVSEAFRHKGLAGGMIGRLVKNSAAFGKRRIDLAVTSSNQTALSLYRHMGFGVSETFMQHIFVADGRK